MDMTGLVHFLSEHDPQKKAVFGFDAFIDRIGRQASGLGDGPIDSVSAFSQRLKERGNKSGTVFLESIEESVGGNAPNTAMTLGSLGGQVHCICAAGYPRIRDVFHSLAKKCDILTYAEPGSCLAVEMGQSKLFFAGNGEMESVTWEEMLRRTGKEQLLRLYAGADLIGLFNWGEIRATQCIWEGLLRDILAVLPRRNRAFFFDFSDISARSAEDVHCLKDSLKRFRKYGKVYVSANLLEARLLDGEELVRNGMADVFITHGKTGASMITAQSCCTLPTRYLEAPLRLTGGGDSFNAGFCYGLLMDLPEENCLMLANAAAGCLIRTDEYPDKAALMCELEASKALWV